MNRDALFAVAAGIASAVLYLSNQWSVFGAFLSLFAPLPLFAAALGRGLAAASIAAAAGALAVAAGGWGTAIVYASTEAVPVVLIARFALLTRVADDGGTEWYPLGMLLTWMTLYGCGGFLILALLAGTGPDGLQGMISDHVDALRRSLGQQDATTPQMAGVIDSIKLVFPFLLTSGWLLVMSLNGVFAQKLLEARGWNRRRGSDLRTIALPEWLAGMVVAAAVVALVGSGWLGFVAVNIVLVLCVPYFLVGLAVLHWVSAAWTGRVAILCAAYLFLLLVGWTALVVVGVGFVENWAGLRNRFGSSGPRDEGND